MEQERATRQTSGFTNIFIDDFHVRRTIEENVEVSYFLTHYSHNLDVIGLNPSWDFGPIYCSEKTALLLVNVYKFQKIDLIRTLPLEKIALIGGNNKVTFYDAGYFPGSICILIESNNKRCLYTPNLRLNDVHLKLSRVDTLYLDTTFAHPKYKFMSQEQSVEAILAQIQTSLSESNNLVILSLQDFQSLAIIGSILSKLNVIVYASDQVMEAMALLPDTKHVVGKLTTNPCEASIHIQIDSNFGGKIGSYYQADFNPTTDYVKRHFCDRSLKEVKVIIPTPFANASSYNIQHQLQTYENITIQLIEYSNRSGYSELCEFVKVIRPSELVPLVYADDRNRLYIVNLFRNFIDHKTSFANFSKTLKDFNGDNLPSINNSCASLDACDVKDPKEQERPLSGSKRCFSVSTVPLNSFTSSQELCNEQLQQAADEIQPPKIIKKGCGALLHMQCSLTISTSFTAENMEVGFHSAPSTRTNKNTVRNHLRSKFNITNLQLDIPLKVTPSTAKSRSPFHSIHEEELVAVDPLNDSPKSVMEGWTCINCNYYNHATEISSCRSTKNLDDKETRCNNHRQCCILCEYPKQ